MAAKSILNELYQRLRIAAPVYKTQADGTSEGFICTLTLPAVDCDYEALAVDRTFKGSGASKKEAEHAAANAAVDCLTEEKVLRSNAAPTTSHSSRCTPAAAAGGPSPSVSSATSGITQSGVGSKRSKSSADYDEESNESLELRILETLAAVYPRTLNGAQLAKMCGHFKLKSKVNHLLYMKLRVAGQVEMLDSHPPAWRAIRASAAAATAGATAAATTLAHVNDVAAVSALEGDQSQPNMTAVAGVGHSCPYPPNRQSPAKYARMLDAGQEQLLVQRQQQLTCQHSGRSAGFLGVPHTLASSQQQQQWGASLPPLGGLASSGHGVYASAAAASGSRRQASGSPAVPASAAASVGRLMVPGMVPGTSHGHLQQQQQHSQHSYSRSYSQGGTLSQSYSQPSHSNTISCGQSTTAATAAAARLQQQQQLAAAGLAALSGGRHATAAADDTDTDDDDISPAVLAAATEAAALEPAPFHAQPISSDSSGMRHPKERKLQQQMLHTTEFVAPQQGARSVPTNAGVSIQQQQQRVDLASMQPHLDLLAAMQLNEQPLQQQQQQEVPQAISHYPGTGLVLDPAVVAAAAAVNAAAASAVAEGMRARNSSRPQLEAGTKRKYPGFSSMAEVAAATAAEAATGTPAAGLGPVGLSSAGLGIPAAAEAAAYKPAGDQLQQHVHHQPLLIEQQGLLIHLAEQQLEQTHSVEHQQPQRRRRRSGRGTVFPVAAAASGGGCFGLERADSTSHSVAAAMAAAAPGVERWSDEEISSDDMQMSAAAAAAAAAAGSSGLCAAEPVTGADGAAADLAAALVHLSAGPSQPEQQQQHLFSFPNIGNAPSAAAAVDHHPGGRRQADAQNTWAQGATANPWQWQWQGQPSLGLLDALAAVPAPAVAAADSEGNGSCLGWPTAGTADPWQLQRLQQQPQSPSIQGSGPGLGPLLRQLSPSPSLSGLSVGASAVVGPSGIRAGSSQPASAAAAAAAVGIAAEGDVDNPMQISHQGAVQPLQQVPQVGHMDLQQSEEQALQLLSRLALPGSAVPAPAAAGDMAAGAVKRYGVTVGACSEANSHAALEPGSNTERSPTDSLSLAVAAAAAAAKAAAAIAAAASFAPGTRQPIGQSAAAEERPVAPAALQNDSIVVPGSGSILLSAAVAADSAQDQQQPGQQQHEQAAATASAYPSQLGAVLAAAEGLAIATSSQVGSGGTSVKAAAEPTNLGQDASAGSAPERSTLQQQKVPNSTPVAAQGGGVVSQGSAQQGFLQPLQQQQQQLCDNELQEEYERRMTTVKDLVQQLNDALQGLNSIREQAERK